MPIPLYALQCNRAVKMKEVKKYNIQLHTVSHKNVITLSCYNFDIHESMLIIFGRNATEKVSNQKMLCFPPHLTNDSALPTENPERLFT